MARTLRRRIAALCAVASVAASLGAQAQPAPFNGLRLLDEQTRRIEPPSLKSRALLINFVFTGCSATCPTQVRELAAVLRGLPADVRADVQFLSVSADPLSDTPATLAAFARRHDAELPGWRFATGDVQQVETLIERMAATDTRRLPRRAEDHRTALWLYDGAGSLVQRYAGVPVDRARLTEELSQLVRWSRSQQKPR